MYAIRTTVAFKKDIKRLRKQNANIALLESVIDTIASNEPLDAKHNDHALNGNWQGFRDCHVEPDWLLIYRRNEEHRNITLARTGSHSELDL